MKKLFQKEGGKYIKLCEAKKEGKSKQIMMSKYNFNNNISFVDDGVYTA